MEIKVQIPFQQLLTAVKLLSPSQKTRLRKELSDEKPEKDDKAAFLELLLNGPVFKEKDIKIIEENRKSISEWRTKS